MVKTVNVLVCQSVFWSTSPPSHHLLVRSWQWRHWCWVLTLSWRRHGIIHGRFPPLEFFLFPYWDMSPEHHFKKLSHHTQCWLCLPIYTYSPISGKLAWPQKIMEVSSDLFPLFSGGGDAMGGPYLIETSPLICAANQWTGFYKIGFSVLKRGVRGWGVTVCWVSIYYEVTFV